MDPAKLKAILEAAPKDKEDYFYYNSSAIVAKIKKARGGSELIPVLLRFMEENSSLDFGSPGAFVHFIETFGVASYREELIQSVRRRPMLQNLWMINRILNATDSQADREQLLDVLREISQ